MPEMNGFEVLSAITQESPETPIIVVSGIGVIQEAIEAIERAISAEPENAYYKEQLEKFEKAAREAGAKE